MNIEDILFGDVNGKERHNYISEHIENIYVFILSITVTVIFYTFIIKGN